MPGLNILKNENNMLLFVSDVIKSGHVFFMQHVYGQKRKEITRL